MTQHTASLGDRLRAERKRLGFSQDDFAKAVGVHRRTQINYELGRRLPDMKYLDSLCEIGVDLGYLFSGSQNQQLEREHFWSFIAAILRLPDNWIDQVRAAAERIISDETKEGSEDVRERMLNELIGISPALQDQLQKRLDVGLLSQILEAVEVALSKDGRQLSSEKKARAVAMVYRVAAAAGKLDRALIDEALALAV